MPKLFIRLLSPAIPTDDGYDIRSEWIIINDDGTIRDQGQTDFRGLSELVDPAATWLQRSANVIVTIPSSHVLTLSCEVPGRASAQIRRALPFVVEEFVTTDIERMHLAHGEVRRGSPVRCNLIERTLLENWLACMAELRIHPGLILAETELLPVAIDQATVLFDDRVVLVRTPAQSASVDRANLALALATLTERRLLLINGDLEPLERASLDPELEVQRLGIDDPSAASTLGFLARQIGAREQGINLLQGAYRLRETRNPHWQQWRMGVGMAAALLLTVLATDVLEAMHASRRADALEAETLALFREIYPDTTRVTNVRRQMQAAMGEDAAGSSLGFIANLDRLSAAITADSRLQTLNYTIERGELAIDLLIPGYEVLDRLKESLGSAGTTVEIVSAEQQDSGVRARVRLREQGGQGA